MIKNITLKKSLFTICIFLCFMTKLFAQDAGLETLSNYNTSWSSVLPGTALCEPEVTSFGFCLVTDARNIMGYSSTGKLLWEKNIGRVRNVNLTTMRGDFILFHLDISFL